MPKKITVAIDIDDTLADSTNTFRLLINERYGVNLTPDDYRVGGEYWGYYERVWASHGLGDVVDFPALDAEMAIDQSHIPLLPGAEFAIHELNKKFELVLITARNISQESATRQWFSGHFSNHKPELVFTDRPTSKKHESKGQACRRLGVSILIDDNPQHCQSAIDQGVEAILFGDYGWQVDISDRITRCVDWPSVLEHFNETKYELPN